MRFRFVLKNRNMAHIIAQLLKESVKFSRSLSQLQLLQDHIESCPQLKPAEHSQHRRVDCVLEQQTEDGDFSNQIFFSITKYITLTNYMQISKIVALDKEVWLDHGETITFHSECVTNLVEFLVRVISIGRATCHRWAFLFCMLINLYIFFFSSPVYAIAPLTRLYMK